MNVLVEGYLKCRYLGHFTAWRERYFLLQDCGDLISFISHKKPAKVASRLNVKDVKSAEIINQQMGASLLELRLAERGHLTKFLLLASNRADAKTWLVTIEELRRKLEINEYNHEECQSLEKTRKDMDFVSKRPMKLKRRSGIFTSRNSAPDEYYDHLQEGDLDTYKHARVKCQCYGPDILSTFVITVEGLESIQDIQERLHHIFSPSDKDNKNATRRYSLKLGCKEKFITVLEEEKSIYEERIFRSCFKQKRMLVIQLVYCIHNNLLDDENEDFKMVYLGHEFSQLVARNLHGNRSLLHIRVLACHLKTNISANIEDQSAYYHTVLTLYHGAEQLEGGYECSTSLVPCCKNPRWNELLSFSILHANLPKSHVHDKERCISSKLVGWSNLHLPSADNRNRIHLHLWQQEPTYSCGTIMQSSNAESMGILVMDIDYLFYQMDKQNNLEPLFDPTAGEQITISPSNKDMQKINILINDIDVIMTTDNDGKKILWHFRHHIPQHPQALARFLYGVEWDKRTCFEEALRLLQIWHPITPFQALQLLGPQYGDPTVRDYATRRIALLSYDEILLILMQLVQVLQYDSPQEESSLLLFLLDVASKNWKISQQLFWHIRTGVQIPFFRRKYTMIFDKFLLTVNPSYQEYFILQETLAKKLIRISASIKALTSRAQRHNALWTSLLGLKFHPPPFLPLDSSSEIHGVEINKCKYMSSKKLPLWIVFRISKGPAKQLFPVIFKTGDDLRQDMLALQLMTIMEKIWIRSGINLRLTIPKCIATGVNDGMIEVIEDAETLSSICKRAGGGRACFQESTIADWLHDHNTTSDLYNMAVDAFIRSCAGYCVATCIIGIGDRHNDNIMLKRNGEIFHIDFGHILGNFKSKFGINRERSRFIFTPDFAFVMGGPEDTRFSLFQSLCVRAFNKIRENANLLLNLTSLMVSAGLPELQCPTDVCYMRDMMLLNMSEKVAGEQFCQWIHESLYTKTSQINNAIHTWKHS